MERFVYISILFCTTIILFLYLYLVIEKTVDIIKNRVRKRHQESMYDLIDAIILKMENDDLTHKDISSLRHLIENKIKMELIEERIIYYLTLYKGELQRKIVELVENTGLVDVEIKNLRAKNLYKISLTCKKLGEFRSKRAIVPLLDILKIELSDVKYNVLLALSKIGDEEAFIKGFEMITEGIPLSERSLIEIMDDFEGDKQLVYEKLFNSSNDFLVTLAMKSASNYMDFRFSELASKFLKDENKEKRIAAIKLIGNAADIRYIDDIIESLNDKEWEIRAIAAKVLERFDDDRAAIPLSKALSDKVWFVRYNAAMSLIKIPGGLEVIEAVLQGEDKFAKDIIIYAVENMGILNGMAKDVELEKQKKIAKIVEDYLKKR